MKLLLLLAVIGGSIWALRVLQQRIESEREPFNTRRRLEKALKDEAA